MTKRLWNLKNQNEFMAGFFLCGVLLWSTPASALGESSARAAGMAGTYTAAARNLDAVGWNPANLALPSDRSLSIAIFSFGFNGRNDAFDLDDYNRYNGKAWNEEVRQEILDKLPPEGIRANASGEARALGISIGRYAVRVTAFGAGRARFPRDPLELALFGNERDRVYNVADTEGKAQAAWSISFSAGHPIRRRGSRVVSVGVTVRYLRGLGFFELQDAQGTLVTLDSGWQLEGSSLARRAEGGRGFSFDLGLAAQLGREWSAGISILQIGRLSWDKNARENRGQMFAGAIQVQDIADVEEFDDLFNAEDQERRLDSFSTSLPTTVRIGISKKTKLSLFNVDWQHGLNDAPGSTTQSRLSVGSEYKMTGWFPVRAGISVGGGRPTSYSAGFGIGVKLIAFDVALRLRDGIVPNRAGGGGLAAELKFGF